MTDGNENQNQNILDDLVDGIADVIKSGKTLGDEIFGPATRPLPAELITHSGVDVSIAPRGALEFSIDGKDYKIPSWVGGSIIVGEESYRGTDSIAQQNAEAARVFIAVLQETQQKFTEQYRYEDPDDIPFHSEQFQNHLAETIDSLENSLHRAANMTDVPSEVPRP